MQANYSAISALTTTVLERRLSSIANIEVQLLRLAGITNGATYLSKAIELTSRADLADDVQPWFESSTAPPGSYFVDVFRQIRETLPPSVLGVNGEQASAALT